MINLGNIESRNTANKPGKDSGKLSGERKVDAVHSVSTNKKVSDKEKSTQRQTKESKNNKLRNADKETEIEEGMYDNRGKKEAKSKINITV